MRAKHLVNLLAEITFIELMDGIGLRAETPAVVYRSTTTIARSPAVLYLRRASRWRPGLALFVLDSDLMASAYMDAWFGPAFTAHNQHFRAGSAYFDTCEESVWQ